MCYFGGHQKEGGQGYERFLKRKTSLVTIAPSTSDRNIHGAITCALLTGRTKPPTVVGAPLVVVALA